MPLIENTLDGKINKVERSISRIKLYQGDEPYWVAYSGGKDSIVVKALTNLSNVNHSSHYSFTSVDPPEVVGFIKKQGDVNIEIPRDEFGNAITMWTEIPKKGLPPSIQARWCCDIFKESQGKGQKTITGVRWAESNGRKNNQGKVTIIGGKRILKKSLAENSANFTQTTRGGWC